MSSLDGVRPQSEGFQFLTDTDLSERITSTAHGLRLSKSGLWSWTRSVTESVGVSLSPESFPKTFSFLTDRKDYKKDPGLVDLDLPSSSRMGVGVGV